jgi:hypothetical protein
MCVYTVQPRHREGIGEHPRPKFDLCTDFKTDGRFVALYFLLKPPKWNDDERSEKHGGQIDFELQGKDNKGWRYCVMNFRSTRAIPNLPLFLKKFLRTVITSNLRGYKEPIQEVPTSTIKII